VSGKSGRTAVLTDLTLAGDSAVPAGDQSRPASFTGSAKIAGRSARIRLQASDLSVLAQGGRMPVTLDIDTDVGSARVKGSISKRQEWIADGDVNYVGSTGKQFDAMLKGMAIEKFSANFDGAGAHWAVSKIEVVSNGGGASGDLTLNLDGLGAARADGQHREQKRCRGQPDARAVEPSRHLPLLSHVSLRRARAQWNR